ncbi:hypothetical protein KBB96_03865 [Luteolibacter ambystomatis]|uniref:Cytochrome c domain-containing protein n=1 Tax=Luteolibacter ambystomatis TaxID=2824561 RepID=A0A975PFH9_9BACT|nr:hypothetical protein [Luteolibacter ambystomatis]QUE52029.1 hypothetical protein KBB96_03865 [Luteolibacter ambystomatis]
MSSALDVWEQPPIDYSKAAAKDPAGTLGQALADGSLKLTATTPLERMKEVLVLLKIPVESQVLVFSKTSKQNPLIDPGNPRALYFSENAYAGYVPGGQMEIIAHDSVLGPVYRTIDLGGEVKVPVMHRQTSDCLSCHGTARTLDVPGVMVRSVFADADGRPLLEFGSTDVNATTPLEQRWGGYYVTGRSSLPHLGNRFFRRGETPQPPTEAVQLDRVDQSLDPVKYPRATSDIVALLVLEHQCQLYNLMTSASYRHRRMSWMARAFDPKADPDTGTAGKLADDDAVKIVDALLFKDAAPMGDGVEGDEAFQSVFMKRFPVTREGDSLADFHLGAKLFKNRCSYMIYSEVFASLPVRVKTAVVKRLRGILEADGETPGYEYLKKPERERIVAILRETLPIYGQ